ncbi:hypothetical protein Efla_007398 [Eimeria flavescens]
MHTRLLVSPAGAAAATPSPRSCSNLCPVSSWLRSRMLLLLDGMLHEGSGHLSQRLKVCRFSCCQRTLGYTEQDRQQIIMFLKHSPQPNFQHLPLLPSTGESCCISWCFCGSSCYLTRVFSQFCSFPRCFCCGRTETGCCCLAHPRREAELFSLKLPNGPHTQQQRKRQQEQKSNSFRVLREGSWCSGGSKAGATSDQMHVGREPPLVLQLLLMLLLMALQLSATSSVFVQLQQKHQQLLQQEHYLVYPQYQQQQQPQQQRMVATPQLVPGGVLLLLYSRMAAPSVSVGR